MRSLTLKLTLAFLLVSLTGIALVAVTLGSFTTTVFNRFVTDRAVAEFVSAAGEYYQIHGSWDGVEAALRTQGFNNFREGPEENRPIKPLFPLADAQGQVVIAGINAAKGKIIAPEDLQRGAAVQVDGKVVGYSLVPSLPPGPNPAESRFLQRMNRALHIAALGAAAIAVVLGLLLARNITRPVKDLTAAASAIANGRLNQQLQVRSNDELGELTRSFNLMSADLERANNLRRQMTADIAHDLRTPLAVITGYLEGLKDGVVKPTQERYEAMYAEAVYLQRLVEDLRTLSLADAGELSINRQPVKPADLLARLAASYHDQAEQGQIQLEVSADPALPPVSIDAERMQQALGNLVGNALRYTPAGGSVCLSAQEDDGALRLDVTDTGSGIPPEALPHVFERFYRGDDSRQEGGSGLGLAIARSIVELHGGTISASSAGEGKGSQFTIRLPAS